MTPVDLRQVSFPHRLRGIDEKAVRAFLDEVAENFSVWAKENADLQARVREQDRIIMELKQAEVTLASTLVSAQKVTDEMKAAAQKEAEIIVRQAEIRAGEITQAATREVSQIQGKIMGLLKQRALFIERVRSLMQSFDKVLEWESEESTQSGGDPAERR
jgi:cell division initiation protein